MSSSVRGVDSVRMLTTAGETSRAMVRNVVASMLPAIGALLAGGAAVTGCAEEVGDRSSREASTMPIATEAIASSTA